MLYREVFKVVGNFLLIFTAILVIPLLVACYYQFIAPLKHPQPHSSLAFVQTLLITFVIALFFLWLGRKGEGRIFRREGILIVAFIWILTSLLGSLPFYFSGTLSNPIQAFFEATSGFSTTGSTVMEPKKYNENGQEIPIETFYLGLERVEYHYYGTIKPVRTQEGKELSGVDAVSRALIFWRSFIQWLGGLGIMVLFVAILPALGVGGKVLLQSEVTGPIKSSMTPRVKETATQLWKIYVALTLLQIGMFWLFVDHLSLFDSIAISFSTLSTGGFAPHSDNIQYWDSRTVDWIVILFMMLGSINFTLYYYTLRGKLYKLWNIELIVFLCVALAICFFGTYQLLGTPRYLIDGTENGIYNLYNAFTDGSFQLIAALTSTGFFTINYDFWPYETQVLMLIAMFIGGMSGSTAGGIKIIRHVILFLVAKSKIENYFRPEAVRSLKVGDHELESGTVINVLCFFLLTISIAVLGTFLYCVDGIDPETSLGLTTCMINNAGLAFRQAGPLNSCAFLSNFSLGLSCLLMLLGRLEFLVILVLFLPSFWKEEK
jgi:trk system potassium uptake protein TrkH